MQEDVSFPVFRLIDENVRATLRRGLPGGVLIFSEHMDLFHFPDPMSQAQKKAWVQEKYAKSKLDLVIGVGDVPTDMFPSVPLVYLNIQPQSKLPNRLESHKDAVSVWVELGAGKTIEVAQRFHPNARQVVVVVGSSPAESLLLDQVRNQLAGYSQQLRIIYLTNLGFSEILKRVETLGPESVVLFVAFTRDGDGRLFIAADAISKIAAVSGAPVYAIFDAAIGSGAVGGYVTRFGELGTQAGKMGLQFLAGRHPKDTMARSDYLFDWRQLQRWKIPESALPVGSVLINRQPTVWESYRRYIVGTIFLLSVQTLLILALLWQRARKKAFQKSLISQMEFQQMVSDLSATFIHLPEESVDATIQQSLSRIAEHLRLDRITLFEYASTTAELKAVHSWHNEEVNPVEVIGMDKLPWVTNLLMRGEAMLVSDLESLPAEASAEKEHLRKSGIISVATVPLQAGDDFFGCISFASARRRVVWTGDLVGQLKLLAEIFSNALMRKRAQEVRLSHSAIVTSAMDAIVSIDDAQRIVLFNDAAEKMFGCPRQEAIGSLIERFIPQRFRAAHSAHIHNFAQAGGSRAMEERGTLWALKANGDEFPIEASICHNNISGKMLFTAIVRDVTERRQAERAIRESEDRFRLVANTAPAMIWMADTDKLCNFFNQSWLHFTGRSMEQELGNGWADGVHPDDLERCLQIYCTAFDARADFQMEYRLRRFDGEYRWVVDFGVPRFESDGNFCGFIGSCVDITERKTSEESLHRLTGRLISAQEEERARIARELHDDFSQRLALLGIGLGQLWKRLSKSGVEERASVQEMLEETKEMSSDLHSLSHQLHSSKLEHVGLVPALNGLCREIGQKYKIAIHFSHFDVPLNIPKDASLCLFRVTQEALANIVKHSGAKEAQVELRVNGAGIALRISDSGRGFDPSSQKPDAGIGMIGMSERLRLVGGQLLVRSQPNCGTEIVAEVPLATTDGAAQVKAQGVGG